MKANPLSGTGKVFLFSLKQICLAKGWLISTVLLSVLMVVVAPLVCWGISAFRSSDHKTTDDSESVRAVFIVDETPGTADYDTLHDVGFADISYQTAESMDDAIAQAGSSSQSVILRITKDADAYALAVYLPEETNVSRSKASKFGEFVAENFKMLLMQKANLTAEETAKLNIPIASTTEELSAESLEKKDDENTFIESLTILLPFLSMMLVYMMVIFYGQSMSNSVLLEKNSKLMETMLTAVNPVALMAGKLLATAVAAVAQLLIWMLSALGGFTGSIGFIIRMMPAEMGAATATELADASVSPNVFPVSGVVLAVLFIALGFFLYLSLSAVAGAMASKAEEVNKTNGIFVIVLLVSFMLCMNMNPEGDSISFVSQDTWLRLFPPTALLLVPAELMLGKISTLLTVGAFVCMVVLVSLLVFVAAVIYKLLLLYRGAPPSPKVLLSMLKQSKTKKE